MITVNNLNKRLHEIDVLSKQLDNMEGLGKDLRKMSDSMSEQIGSNTLRGAQRFNESQVQAALAKAELHDTTEEKRLESEKELLIGAMLHDFYLYDWHIKDRSHRLHGYHHADRALDNAVRYFDVDERIQHIIWCHMWPLNISRLPKTKEAIIVCIADKICSAKEILFQR